jgi:histidinol-phosphatase (PHP family)
MMDYHVHTEASPDAKGKMEECIREARKKGIGEIGFSDHVLLHPDKNGPCMPLNLMSNYIQKFMGLKEKSELPIKLGVEIDFVPDDVEKMGDFIQKYPFDYVIGSVHFLGDWCVDYPPQINEYSKRGILQAYEEYFSLIGKACDCRLFDVLAHPDIIKIFGFKPKDDFSYILREAAEAMARSGICAEINTKGLRRPCAEIYPSEQFLTIMHSYDVPVVFGSDAHAPEEVGCDFEKAITLAKKVGYTSACVFANRKRATLKI